jgi:hypothetical protein
MFSICNHGEDQVFDLELLLGMRTLIVSNTLGINSANRWAASFSAIISRIRFGLSLSGGLSGFNLRLAQILGLLGVKLNNGAQIFVKICLCGGT